MPSEVKHQSKNMLVSVLTELKDYHFLAENKNIYFTFQQKQLLSGIYM